MKIVCIADTHNLTDELELPDGDVLVVAGDICGQGRLGEVAHFHRFIKEQSHRHKVVIAGNHDWPFMLKADADEIRALKHDVIYLQDSGCEIDGVRFWGSPWQPEFFGWAFNLYRGKALAEKWAMIPDDTDVLLTHTPPYGILDRLFSGESVGCDDLTEALVRVRPKLHVFGHIHNDYGIEERGWTIYVNACVCTERYLPYNSPIVLEI